MGGFKKLLPLLTPVYDEIVAHSLSAHHWHADETGWKVFEKTEDKKNSRWYLWVFRNTETVVYKIDSRRSSQVLIKHFGAKSSGGVLNVDRYVAYKVIAKSGLFMLAFCWAHVRRDFLNHSKSQPEQEAWGLEWVAAINHLYHLNHQRIQASPNSEVFEQYHRRLNDALERMQATCRVQLSDNGLPPSSKKLLRSLEVHWEGLTLFMSCHEIPMDNNLAERSLRNRVLGRKNY